VTIGERAKKVLFQNYRTQPVAIVRGAGAEVWDENGKRYLDLLGGIAVATLGHAHPRVVAALKAQAEKLWHISNLYYTEPQVALAERLVSRSFAKRCFFCNSGAEANEGALKLARRFHFARGAPREEIVCAHDSFHGRTYGALAATGQPKYHEGFAPLPGGFTFVPYGDADALRAAVTAKTAAVMLEPIQGESGVKFPPAGYLRAAREICDRTGALFILDEVQTGMGRTGKLFAHEYDGIAPDICTVAKGIANGAPLGALLATEEAAAAFTPGTHASTFGGNPLACAAACAVFDELYEGGALEKGARAGARLLAALSAIRERHPKLVADVRGRGMLLALELSFDGAAQARDLCRESGALVNAIGERVIRLAPPLLLTDAQIELGAKIIEHAVVGVASAARA
jgi:predicted acetylornithine/succinylornithine family transaminase